MLNLFRVIIVIVFSVVLTACMDTNNDGNPADNNKSQNQDVLIDKEDNSDDQKENEEQNPSESESPDKDIEKSEVVIENEAFRIFEPTPNANVNNRIVVRGLARVFEGSFKYEFEDGHFILDEGFTTASEGAPGWGEFEFTINLGSATDGPYMIVIYEESAKDGTMINELIIPVHVSK